MAGVGVGVGVGKGAEEESRAVEGEEVTIKLLKWRPLASIFFNL